MEDHVEMMKGKQALWSKQVKDDLFEGKDQITPVRIGQKIANIKGQWKKARAMIDQSGWGLRPEENEQSINAVLLRS